MMRGFFVFHPWHLGVVLVASSPRSRWASRAAGTLALLAALSACAPLDAPAPGHSGDAPATATGAPSASAPSTTTPPAGPSAPGEPAPRETSTSEPPDDESGEDTAPEGSARAALAELTVKGRAPKTGYSREQFGMRWADTDRNGCDTRNDILRRDLTNTAVAPGTQGCKVVSGGLTSPFTGEHVDFIAGAQTSSDVQIDHVVALSDAWQKGAQALDATQRTEFANDPLNLLAVDGPSNSAKGDGDAATWLPPATEFRCEYVALQIAVKQRYELWVTDAEKSAMDRVLGNCPNQPLPVESEIPGPSEAPATPVSPQPTPEIADPFPAPEVPAAPVPPIPTPVVPGDLYFSKCADARAAGAAPLYVGQPGYRPGLDGDGDGVACEPRR